MFRIFVAVLMTTILAGIPVMSEAASSQQKKAVRGLSQAPEPFGLVLGATSFDEAKAVVGNEGATDNGAGYGDAKPSYGDNDPDGVANKKVVLFDVSGLPLDNLETARLGFFEDHLYLIRYTFKKGADFDKIHKQLEAKYGKARSSGGFDDESYEWSFAGGVYLNLQQEFFGDHKLTFIHNPLASKVKQSNSQVYAEHIKSKASTQRGL